MKIARDILVITTGGGGYHWHQGSEVRDAVKHSTVHRAGAPAKNDPAQDVKGAKLRNPSLYLFCNILQGELYLPSEVQPVG